MSRFDYTKLGQRIRDNLEETTAGFIAGRDDSFADWDEISKAKDDAERKGKTAVAIRLSSTFASEPTPYEEGFVLGRGFAVESLFRDKGYWAETTEYNMTELEDGSFAAFILIDVSWTERIH